MRWAPDPPTGLFILEAARANTQNLLLETAVPAPDEGRRPVPISVVAAHLNVAPEALRRRAGAAERAGLCRRTARGVGRARGGLVRAEATALVEENAADVQRLFIRLDRLGGLGACDGGLGGDPGATCRRPERQAIARPGSGRCRTSFPAPGTTGLEVRRPRCSVAGRAWRRSSGRPGRLRSPRRPPLSRPADGGADPRAGGSAPRRAAVLAPPAAAAILVASVRGVTMRSAPGPAGGSSPTVCSTPAASRISAERARGGRLQRRA